MSNSIVLNEASLPFESIEDCEKNIQNFFYLLHEIKNHNIKFSRVDEVEGAWNKLNYADGFNFDKWISSIDDIEQQRKIKSVISGLQCPLTDMNINKKNINVKDILFIHNDHSESEVLGLGFAHLNDSYSFSAESKEYWAKDEIPITLQWYEEDEYKELPVRVPNISSSVHFDSFLLKLDELRTINREYFSKLQVKDNNDFPNLLFTETFIKSMALPSTQLLDCKQVLYVLKQLNNAICQSGNLIELRENSSLSITKESIMTMQNAYLARLRRFKHPDLGDIVFEPHVKNFDNGKRMHIYIDYSEKKICIGYFGKHLKTSSD